MNRTVCTATATRAGSMPIMLSAPYLPQLVTFQMPTVGMPPYLISPYTSFMHSPNHPLAGHIKPQSHLLPVITQASSFIPATSSPSASPQGSIVTTLLRSSENKGSTLRSNTELVSSTGSSLSQGISGVTLSPSSLGLDDLHKQSVHIEVQENQAVAHSSQPQVSSSSTASSSCHSTPRTSLLFHSQRMMRDALRTGNSSGLEKLLQSPQGVQFDPLYMKLQDEPHFVSLQQYFTKSKNASHLRMRVLTTEGTDAALKWVEITRQASHIDPTFGPVDVARILISSNGLCKVQLLFPYFKTIYTKFMPINQEEADNLFDELSPRHVLCPGLPEYKDKYTVLGYHPTHVRVLETPYLLRYDHEKCPIWHIPASLYSKSVHLLHNMCKHCKYLQNNVVRLATKACEVDPSKRQSWTDPSSNRPLAYMSTADREERYRKLRQERMHLLNKLKNYEERLGISSAESAASIKSESGESEREDVATGEQQAQIDWTTSEEMGDNEKSVEIMDNRALSEDSTSLASSEPVSQSSVQQNDAQRKGLKRLAKKRTTSDSRGKQAVKKSRVKSEVDERIAENEIEKSTKRKPRRNSNGRQKTLVPQHSSV